jgi:hypothetical protein
MSTRAREFEKTRHRHDNVNRQTRFSNLNHTSLLKFEWFAGSQVRSNRARIGLLINWSDNTGQMLCLALCNHAPRSNMRRLTRERVHDRPAIHARDVRQGTRAWHNEALSHCRSDLGLWHAD